MAVALAAVRERASPQMLSGVQPDLLVRNKGPSIPDEVRYGKVVAIATVTSACGRSQRLTTGGNSAQPRVVKRLDTSTLDTCRR